MADQPYPPGDKPPPLLKQGPGFERLNEWFTWLTSMSLLPMDATVKVVPGTATSPGRIGAIGTGSKKVKPSPLSIVAANTASNPNRVRIYNGTLGNLLPVEMNVPDGVLADGTDNSCYLYMSNGDNYIYGKVLVNSANGTYTSASVYRTGSTEDIDGTYAYLLIGTVQYNSSTKVITISQYVVGSQSLLVQSSADGTLLQPLWGSGY